MSEYELSNDFANAWDIVNGYYSSHIGNNLVAYIKSNKKVIKTAIDICCRSGNLLCELNNNGFKCFGTDSINEFIEFAKIKQPNIQFVHTNNEREIPFKGSYDLITCINAIFNSFNSKSEINLFLKDCYKHISNQGMVFIELLSKNEIIKNSVSLSQAAGIDLVFQRKIIDENQAEFTYKIYTNYNDYAIKSKLSTNEYFYNYNEIIDEFKKVGFKNTLIVDEEFNTINNLDSAKKIFVIAMKK